MIILKHLTVERFRLLRELNLHFPQRGSILIQGPNEAGKSALLESIYFALYGEALTSNHEKHTLDELVLYGATTATVTLTFSVSTTELTVTRTIERGKGQNAVLQVQRLGMPTEEPITEVAAINERIIAEMGCMDGETLRNSCLLEQKALRHLEKLRGSEREVTVCKLLGLEQFMSLTDQFQITAQDEQLLHECREQLRLAEIQARIPQVSEQLEQVEAALDAVRVLENLDEISQQEADIAEQEQALDDIHARRTTLKIKIGRVQQLKKADATLAEIIVAYDDIAEARRELPELEQQIAELELREREELPTLEKRVNELAELTRSFGTLQRMSNDLLTAVDTIKDLEHELDQFGEARDDLKSVEEEVAYARKRVEEAQQALHELEERRRAGRPQLEARIQRLANLSERLAALRQAEEQYARRVRNRGLSEGQSSQLGTAQEGLHAAEQELAQVEAEAQQAQQQADALEMRWRQLSASRQIQEWRRLKGLAQGLSDAEMQVRVAHEQQARLTQASMDARNAANLQLLLCIGAVALCLLAVVGVLYAFLQGLLPVVAIAGVAAIGFAAAAVYCYMNYGKASKEKGIVDAQMQQAINKMSTMVAARESAVRTGGNQEALAQIEHELRSLGGPVPRSLEEAQFFLQQANDQGESLSELQQRLQERLEAANAVRNRANTALEKVKSLRQEYTHLDDQYKQEDWDNIEENILMDQAAVERLQQEVIMLAGQEGLPLPSINARLQGGVSFDMYASTPSGLFLSEEGEAGIPELEALVEGTIKATEYEIASIDGKVDLAADLASQVKVHQEALDVLQARQKIIEERNARYETNSPEQQIERARSQQADLRQALQSLQDSLRQRVKALGITFGQTAINGAEAVARKQLESLQITLGSKIMLQEKHDNYVTLLKDRQVALAEHYKQLAKYSNTLGAWIVPPNPFAEALVGLRTRCQREIEEANEASMMKELDTLEEQEGASKARIELCHQDIEEAQERIANLFTLRSRPSAKSYTLNDLVAVWPLLSSYTVQDRRRLTNERMTLEDELTTLEEQELELSEQLQTGNTPLDLEQARTRMEHQERSYESKQQGNQLIKEVQQRLLRKMQPRTEHYLHQILPLLTSGRYHDVRLTVGQEEGTISGGPFQMRVWDSAASEYVPKSALSGGAADQLSLALRLAFAIAVLPRELNAAPGFVILDEPLSSFDRGRTQALVDVVTGDILGQHFEQIILISHSSAFDPTMFPYHIYMDNGLVVESNLPTVPPVGVMPTLAANGLKETPLPDEVAEPEDEASELEPQPEHAVAE
ncbi:MAG TPA: AAA family ATPase [Ktedonosporobacter sp.]|nr:AAA family ATPase [Ktedonosporobacter sp.]